MEILSRSIEIIVSLFEVFIILMFINRFLDMKISKNYERLQFIISFCVISVYMIFAQCFQSYVLGEYNGLFDIVGMLIFIVYTFIFFNARILDKILVPVLSISFIMLVNNLLVIILTNAFHFSSQELSTMGLPRIFVLFTGKILYLILSELIIKFYKGKETYLEKPEVILILGMAIFSLVMMFELMSKILAKPNDDISLYVLLFISTALIDIFVFFVLKMISDRNRKILQYRMEKMKNENIVNLYVSTKTIYTELQTMKHDLKNQMLILYDYIEKDEKDKAFDFINEIVEYKLKRFVTYVNTGSDIVDTILNVKLNLARENNIAVDCSIGSDFKTNDNESIVAVISNAIDNAIEACEKVEDPTIVLFIFDRGKYTNVLIKNSIYSSVLNRKNIFKTSKKEDKEHGFGIHSMQKVCKECNGLIEFYEEENTFITHIMFPKK